MIAKAFTMTTQDGRDMTETIEDFSRMIGLEAAAPGRVSLLLTLQLWGGAVSGTQNPEKIIHEIRSLEGLTPPSRFREGGEFRHLPLKGLMHQHYLPDGLPSIARNVKRGLQKYGIPYAKQKIEEAKAEKEDRYFSIDDVAPIINSVFNENLASLARLKDMSGEWLIYARDKDLNYYLCIGSHDVATHSETRRQIEAVCSHEFEFLSQILTDS